MKEIGYKIYPYKLKLFDVETKLETTLFEINYVSTPVFSPDSKRVCFLSSENCTEKYIYNFLCNKKIKMQV